MLMMGAFASIAQSQGTLQASYTLAATMDTCHTARCRPGAVEFEREETLEKPPVHHTPDFMINEKVLIVGVKALSNLTVDYLDAHKK